MFFPFACFDSEIILVEFLAKKTVEIGKNGYI